ncbi:MAG: 16S rRNA (cytidine(1402)-2'-O)-methyltransferase [Ignavibacteriae bacterium HGW-Ignavibacteriae-2]|jgi:16S rRNA (cytidine1402-2'-O)-methyltransferase|nr:MAG: 16S rRNA (cytidine(1402)-2'-O)-methyltransferase [Ignavibacteriae bacterium HGW-Ignavibacteriae-2]
MSALFVVATPIGNLRDITLRALDILKEVDFIICEDTRVTSVLLKHYDIHKELISFNARTEEKKIEFIISRLANGETCALVSDAGTPCISDPGVRLVNAVHKKQIEIVGIPGASGVILALSIAGLPTDSFLFEGFLPQKKGRQKKLGEISTEDRTVVLYESVYRINKLMNELNSIMPDRLVVVCKELTKKFEQIWRGKPNEFRDTFNENNIKGEFVILIAPSSWVHN